MAKNQDSRPDLDTLDDLLVPGSGKNQPHAAETNTGHGRIYAPSKEDVEQDRPDQTALHAAAEASNQVLKKLADPGYTKRQEELAKAMTLQTKPVHVAFGSNKIEISAEARDVPNMMHMDDNVRTVKILRHLLGDQLTINAYKTATRCGFQLKMALWVSQKIQEACKGFRVNLTRVETDEMWNENGDDELENGETNDSSSEREAIRMVLGSDNLDLLTAAAKYSNMSTVCTLRNLIAAEIKRIQEADAYCIAIDRSGLGGSGLEEIMDIEEKQRQRAVSQ
jgi:hypothetical protein